MRLQKFMAKSGVASRRKSEQIILDGRVTVNNITIKELGTKVDLNHDIVCVDGKKIFIEDEKVYYMLNKPTGYVTTVKDEKGRNTVIDLLSDVTNRVYPVGRLDYDTSGLLLLTNDGDLTYRITHPKYEVPKKYVAVVRNTPSEKALETFRNGLIIDGYMTSKAGIQIIEKDSKNSTLLITIREGRNRQVRKMCAKIGHPVLKLKRIAIGEIELGKLPIGEYRILTKDELIYLKSL